MAVGLKLAADSQALLDPGRGALLAPLRNPAAPAEGYAAVGRQLALEHGAGVAPRRTPTFFPRLRANIVALHAAHRCIARQAARGHHVSPAGEWLLDNIHVLAAQTREVHDGLPRRYYRGLPVLAGTLLGGLPRIYGIAWAFVAATDSRFDEDTLVEFVCGYQEHQPLALGELWALPTTLRVVLIENMRRLAERVASEEAAREAADLLCDRRAQADGVDAATLFARTQRRGVGAAFALQVMQRLHADSESATERGMRDRERIRAALAAALPDPAAAQAQQQTDLVADNHSVAQGIRALQLLGSADWRGIVTRSSVLMHGLLQSGVFAAERDDTQDITLHAVERLARHSKRSEPAVAATLIGLMRSPPAADLTHLGDTTPGVTSGAPTDTAGHWLDGPGTTALHAALGYRMPLWRWFGQALRRHVLPLYLSALLLGTAALTWLFIATATAPGASFAALLVCALLALWPASEVINAAVHRLVGEWVPPRRPPRLALADGIPPEHRVLVVVPAMLTDEAGIQELMAQLEHHHLANRESCSQFALLSDFGDADSCSVESDSVLLAAALSALSKLEARHPREATAPRRFLLLHRGRTWCESEQQWIGWERKRGKLEQLVALLAEPGSPSPFVDLGAASRPVPGTTYVLTLDSDTTLPPGALRELIGVAAHPLNQPRIDLARRRVRAGHAILQPRVDVAWPAPGAATPYHRMFAGSGGNDPYNAASSDVYSDLFDEASFSGKGLLHVAAVHAVLGGRLPADQVLSHDLVEGAIARCGGVSDVQFTEPAPSHADVAAARLHRWTRGDWQLWPLLLHPRRFGLRLIDCWKMLDNLRRSLVVPLSLLLLGVALAGGPVSAWAALALGAAAFGTGPLLGAIAGLAPRRDDVGLRHFIRGAAADLGRAVAATLWQIAMWPRQATLNASAIALALWRTTVSHRRLLQWTTAAAAQAAAAHQPRELWRRHGRLALASVAFGAVLLLAGTPQPWLLAVLCLVWAGTPWWTGWASRPVPPAAETLGTADKAYLRSVARDTWRFFEQHVGAPSHHLPPDNVQSVPITMVAQRTSPTNIGLYLLSVACARAFGWIDTEQMLARCEATLGTLDTLPRHRGHFVNWIDTQTLQPLPPAYLSTVDSGNLCAHLLTLAGACDAEHTRAPHSGFGPRLADVAARCRALAEATEFGFLFDPRRRLLHIGWRVAEDRADPGYYDLLASEARLAGLWAIAKGDVPASHWSALGRPFQAAGRHVGLRSWSGSMFEYLMPTLVVDEPPGSALHCAARMAVHEQRAYARRHGLPWGVSECAHAAVDRTLAYQYGPQGVPRLALRRSPAEEFVVAPYATALAALIEPRAAVANLRELEAMQARGPLGFVEALDFTPQRQTDAARFTVVNTTMAHHQGMTLVALAHVLLNELPRRWGMADPRLAAVASLLQERVPREVARVARPLAEVRPPESAVAAAQASGELYPGGDALPPTQLLSNGRYSVALRPNGAGWSRLGAIDISRWRDDALRDAHGSFVFLRRSGSAEVHSITQHPAPDAAAHYQARFDADRVVLSATWPDLRTCCTVWVSPEDDVELRRIELWNTSAEVLTVELLSMFEVCLSQARADEMHPAFANLFVAADWNAAQQVLTLARKPRRAEEPALHAVHFIAHADACVSPARAQADRARWRGRLRGAWQPRAAFDAADLESGPRATGLDPVAALSMRLTLPPHGAAQLTLGTAAAPQRDQLQALVARYRRAGSDSALVRAARLALPREGALKVSSEERAAVQCLTTALVLLLAKPAAAISDGVLCDRRSLWRFGISGDRPLISVRIAQPQGLRLVRSLMQALAWWTRGGVACDVVLINAEQRSYLMPLQGELELLRETHAPAADTGGLFLCHANEMSATERASLALLARVRLHADGRPLSQHVAELVAWHEAALTERDAQDLATVAEPGRAVGAGATLPARRGRFEGEDDHYTFDAGSEQPTPRPWVNVLANPAFGALASEAGGGCTFAGNSRLNQLTPWGNDPLEDMDGEAFYVHDQRTPEVWQIGRAAATTVTHGLGITRIAQHHRGLQITTTWCVDAAAAVKRVHIEVHNRSEQTRRLRIVGVLEWLLGAIRVDRRSVGTSFVTLADEGPRIDLLLATQLDDHDSNAGQTAFLAVHRAGNSAAVLEDWTCDRRELFDSRGMRVVPYPLGRQAPPGGDPCAAAAASVRVGAGEAQACVFVIGHAATAEAALVLARQTVLAEAGAAEHNARSQWTGLLGAVQVHTPDPLFDAMVNHWLLYQAVACRLWARAGFYQAGGAYGFRDQLQDAMALAVSAPQLLRAQLLRAAARQFVEGDVQHWWHPASGAGARTHFSDDLLWLPHATVHYLRVTADSAVLDEVVPFIEGQAVPPGAEDAYYTPRVSALTASLYEHGARTIDRSLAVGAHGLPLMGGGDWNDGMNLVGHEGRGESVFLGWFLCALVRDYAPLATARGERERARRWLDAAENWQHALQTSAWDGQWFVRAFFDDGSPLGSRHNAECRIDLVAQAWSVLSGAATPQQQQLAMASAQVLLGDEPTGLWRLLTPPLADAEPSAGYIQAYPPGVRENGGQYSHAAAWGVMALAELGDSNGAWRAWTWLSPAHRAQHEERGARYGLEPYVMAADVYTQPPYVGRGGWSWYTGSAAVMHRAAVESICGLQLQGTSLRLRPHLPSHWPAITLELELRGRHHRLTVCAAWAEREIAQARSSGATPLAENAWLMLDDLGGPGGAPSHHLVVCGGAPATAPAEPATAGRILS